MTLPVVLLHSLGLHGAGFEALVAELGPGRVVLTPDLPGHGSTARLDGPMTPFTLAQHVIAVLETTGPVHLVGHSLGGAVASELTAARPDLVADLAIVASPPQGYPSFADRAAAIDVEGTLQRWFSASVLSDGSPGVGFARDCLAEFDPVSWRELWLGFADWRGSSVLAGLDLPLLVVAGDVDLSTPAAAVQQILTAAGRVGEPVVIAEAAHQVPLEQPQALARVLEAWWAAVETTITTEEGATP